MESTGASRFPTTRTSGSSRDHELPILDAGRVGFPQRMRDYLKRQKAARDAGSQREGVAMEERGPRPAGTAGGGEGI
jgi:hypothetical protein